MVNYLIFWYTALMILIFIIVIIFKFLKQESLQNINYRMVILVSLIGIIPATFNYLRNKGYEDIDITHNLYNNNQIERGIIYWPTNNQSDLEIKDNIDKILTHSTIIVHTIQWDKDSIDFNLSFANIAREHNRKVMINFDWMNTSRKYTRGNFLFSNLEIQKKFIEDVMKIINIYKPDYVNLGVEVNYLALNNPDEFINFVELYNKTKQQIKEIHINTQVLVSFQLELLHGKNSNTEERIFDPLIAFNQNFDILGISTYPSLGGDSILNISRLKEIEKMTTKKIGIVETSLPTNQFTETSQKKYLIDLTRYMKENSKKYKILIWTSISDIKKTDKDHEQEGWIYHLGLIDSIGKSKLAFETWIEL